MPEIKWAEIKRLREDPGEIEESPVIKGSPQMESGEIKGSLEIAVERADGATRAVTTKKHLYARQEGRTLTYVFFMNI